ncbi:MAG: PDZ domain-containing protein [Vicinamibacterales bacterium]
MERPPTNVKYVTTLAVVAGLILAIGSVFRPRTGPSDQPPPNDTDLARLSRLTDRRSLESRMGFLGQVADAAAGAVVWLDESASTGVVWEDDTIATARLTPRHAPLATVRIDGVARRPTVTEWAPGLPVIEFRVAGLGASAPVRADEALASGQPLVAVWRTARGRAFADGAFASVTDATCSGHPVAEITTTLPLGRAMAGGGLFDLDAHLVGFIVPCDGRFAALTPAAVDALLRETVSFANRLRARYGLVVGELTDAESAYFDTTAGVPVRELAVDEIADLAGLRPGDVIVGLNGAPVARLSELQPMAARTPLAAPVLTVVRDGKRMDIALAEPEAVPGTAPSTGASGTGLLLEPEARTFEVEGVVAGSPAAAAGLAAGDLIVRVGRGEPRSVDQVRRLLAGPLSAAVFVEVRRDGRRMGALLSPGI